MHKNILVTGGRGQLGCCFKKISGEYKGYNFLFVDLPEADITDREVMKRLLHDNEIDTVINCAAYVNSEKAETEGAADAYKVNVTGVALLADIAAETGCSLVHISTDYVFRGELQRPLTETDRASPLGVYGKTKLEGERKVLTSEAAAIVVRTSWLYSEFGSNFMKTMLRLSETNDKIRVVDDQKGTPTYGVDLAVAIMALVGRGISGRELYHFSDCGAVTWCGFAKEIMRQSGKKTEIVPISSAEFASAVSRPEYSVLDTSKIKSLGIVIPEWKSSLSKCLAAYMKV